MFGEAAAGRSRDRFAVLTGLLIATAFLVASCGGGGGGDGGGGGSGDAFSLSTTSVVFNATQGGTTPTAQGVNVVVNFGTVFIGTSQSGGQFSHTPIVKTGQNTGVITITPSAPNNPGTSTGTITVFGCTIQLCNGPGNVAGSPKTINVTYNVAGTPTLSVTPSALDFQATSGGALPVAKAVNVDFSNGSATWNASVSPAVTWLSLSDATGATPDTLNFNIVGPLPAAGVHTATVTFTTTTPGITPRTVAVTLTVSDPRVNFVSPYVVTPLTTGDVIIRGHGFAAGGLQVLFNNTQATAATRVSETEIRATHPALLAGTYAVNVNNGGLNMTTRANLVVSDLPAFPAVTLDRSPTFANPGAVGQLIYDAERQAVFLMDAEQNRIERYRFNGIGWDTASLPNIGSVGINPRIALSPDGTELLKTSNNAIERILASTFTHVESVSTLTFTGGTGLSLNRIAFANDGRAIGSSSGPSGITLYRYDMLTKQFASLSTQSDMVNRNIVASGDGDTIVLPTAEPLAPASAKPVFVYDASQGDLLQTGVSTTQSDQLSLSRNGSRALMTSVTATDKTPRVFNYAPLAFLGDLGLNANASVITPDGTHLYVFFSGTGLVRKFSINPFSEVGVPINVASPGTQLDPAMTISPDGSRLFLAGSQRLIILSVPVP